MHDQDDGRISGSGRRIVLALQRKPPRLDRELAAAVAGELAQRGAVCDVVEDGDARALAADALWLLSDAPAYVRYPWMLRRHAQRPRTVLWQMHPLPPLEIPAEAERVGLEAAAVGQRMQRSAERWLRGFGRSAMLRRWLNRRYWRRTDAGFGQALAMMQNQPAWPWRGLDVGSVRGMMERYLCIRGGLGSGGWLDRVCVSTMGRAEFLRRRGIESTFVPIGWHGSFGCDGGSEREGDRDIDVLFLGRVSPGGRRAILLERIERRLAQERTTLHRVEGDCFGEERAAMLSRARVVLNLNKYPWDAPWLRFVMAAGCWAVVVSESLPGSDDQPWHAGVHYVSASPAELAEAVIDLLRDAARLAAIRRAAAELVAGPLTLSASVRTLLNVSVATGDRRG